MLRINFYGGPGVGKSTLAARVYVELNRACIEPAELVQEFIKAWVYEGKRPDAFDQVYTFASQLHAEHRLAKAGIRVIVTDSPVLLQCVYASLLDSPIGRDLTNLALQFEHRHQALNFFVRRQVAYNPVGRYQMPDELAALDASIRDALDSWAMPYLSVVPDDWPVVIQTVKEAAYSL